MVCSVEKETDFLDNLYHGVRGLCAEFVFVIYLTKAMWIFYKGIVPNACITLEEFMHLFLCSFS